MARARRAVAAGMAIAAVLGAAARAAADDEAAPTPEEGAPPSPALLVVGIATAVGGGALQYTSARHFADSASASVGWLALGGVGGVISEVGGAVAAYWGWRLGENHLAFDRASGGPVKERRTLALTALGVGAAALVVEYGAALYLFVKSFDCEQQAIVSGGALGRCAGDQIVTATVVQLAANGVLLVVAPIAGYGFGYDDAAKRTEPGHGFRLSLAPAFFAAGARATGLAGLRLTVHF